MEISNKKYWMWNLLLGITILCLVLPSCKEKNDSNAGKGVEAPVTGVVLFVVGNVQSGTKKIKVGDIIVENESIQTGKQSTCDLQIQNSEAGIVMRMKSESTFQLGSTMAKGKRTPNTMLSSGNALINVSKKLKAEENFNVVTPTMVAGVRGTKFEVNVKNDGSTTVVVSEGKVATHARIAEVEELPMEVQEKSLTISSIKDNLASEEKIIEPGQGLEITKSQTDKILKATGLGESLKLASIASASKLNEQEVLSAVNTIDKSFQADGKSNQTIQKSVQENFNSKVSKVTDSDLQAKLKEYSELIAVEREKLETSESKTLAVKERNKQIQEVLVKRIEQITGKSFETLLLKSGKKVRGIIFLEGDSYHVITQDGQETFKEDDVEGMEL